MFNLGAVLCKLAQEQDRQDPEGIAKACQLLQVCALRTNTTTQVAHAVHGHAGA